MPELPGSVRYVAIDFNRQNLAEVLDRNEFNRGQPTIFVWEGVTNYLSSEAMDAVLRYVGAAPQAREWRSHMCIATPLMGPQDLRMQTGSLVMSRSLASVGALVLFPRSCPLTSASED